MELLKEKVEALKQQFGSLSAIQNRRLDLFLETFNSEVSLLEQFYDADSIKDSMSEIRDSVSASPFLQRAQQWPKGYPGDFQTIAYILDGKNKAPAGTVAYEVEDYFLKAPICQQHRNKVMAQKTVIQDVVTRNSKATLLSIGCGTSEDLFQCKDLLLASDCRIVLVDMDEEALAYSLERLQGLHSRITVVQGNIYKIIKTIAQHFDLILIGGVFDYLKDKVVKALISELKPKMKAGGRLFFTNIATGNPYRASMEYLANWKLIERSEAQLRDLLEASGTPMPYTITQDATGLAHLVTICQSPAIV